MHCPRCGQQQVSEEIKYCSRCGFPLSLVSEIVAHGGFLPQLAELENKNEKWLTRRFGLKVSLFWFLLLTFILVPLAAITDAPEELIAGLAVLGFCGGILMMMLSFLFLKSEKKSSKSQADYPNEGVAPQHLRGNQNQTALPPQTSQPVSSYAPPAAGLWKAPETGDLVPNSVTEGTTKLLRKDE